MTAYTRQMLTVTYLPLNDNPNTPNEAYFKQVDYVIDKAAEYNLVIGLLPTWGDKILKINGALVQRFLTRRMQELWPVAGPTV